MIDGQSQFSLQAHSLELKMGGRGGVCISIGALGQDSFTQSFVLTLPFFVAFPCQDMECKGNHDILSDRMQVKTEAPHRHTYSRHAPLPHQSQRDQGCQ